MSESTNILLWPCCGFPSTRIFFAPVVQKVDGAIHCINLYPADSVIDFPNSYPLHRDFSMDSSIHYLNNWGLMITITESNENAGLPY